MLSGILGAVAWAGAAAAAERAEACVTCAPSDEKLVYDCMITLTRRGDGAPMDGAEIVVGADMPAMPMVHNVKPVNATPTGAPGVYHARIALEMYGDWVLTMEVSGPTRDKLIHKLHAGDMEREGEGHEMHEAH